MKCGHIHLNNMHPLTKEELDERGLAALHEEFGLDFTKPEERKQLAWFYDIQNQSPKSPTYPVTLNSLKSMSASIADLPKTSASELTELGNLYVDWVGYIHGDLDDNEIGEIIYYAGTGWDATTYHECDGTTFNQTTYPELYAVLGEAKYPDLRGVVTALFGGLPGVSKLDSATKAGDVYGSDSVVLTVPNIPNHKHSSFYYRDDPYHRDGGDNVKTKNFTPISGIYTDDSLTDSNLGNINKANGSNVRGGKFGYPTASQSTTNGMSNEANSQAHENRQPYAVVVILIKIKD